LVSLPTYRRGWRSVSSPYPSRGGTGLRYVPWAKAPAATTW
jgi:hypothetical protein